MKGESRSEHVGIEEKGEEEEWVWKGGVGKEGK